jgi:hypothetical protein
MYAFCWKISYYDWFSLPIGLGNTIKGTMDRAISHSLTVTLRSPITSLLQHGVDEFAVSHTQTILLSAQAQVPGCTSTSLLLLFFFFLFSFFLKKIIFAF